MRSFTLMARDAARSPYYTNTSYLAKTHGQEYGGIRQNVVKTRRHPNLFRVIFVTLCKECNSGNFGHALLNNKLTPTRAIRTPTTARILTRSPINRTSGITNNGLVLVKACATPVGAYLSEVC